MFCGRSSPVIPRNQPIKVIHGSAGDLVSICRSYAIDRLGAMVSNLPLSTFPDPLRESVLESSVRVLPPGGRFAQFTYLPMTLVNDLKPDLQPYFGPLDREESG